MSDFWQIIRTDLRGRVTGETYSNPAEALLNFVNEVKLSKKDIYANVLFKELNSTVVTFGDDELTYAYLKIITYPSGNKEAHIVFSCERTLEEVKANVEACKIPEGYQGRYYSEVTAVDFKTGKVVAKIENPLPKPEEESKPTVKINKENNNEGVQNASRSSKRKPQGS